LRSIILTIFCCLSVTWAGALAQSQEKPASLSPVCAVTPIVLPEEQLSQPADTIFISPALPDANIGSVQITTGKIEAQLNGDASFADSITIRSGQKSLSANQGTYSNETGIFEVSGGVEYIDAKTRILGERAMFNASAEQVEFEAAEFQFPETPARGTAGKISVSGTQKLRLMQVTYTSCAPGNTDWLLSAEKIKIDRGDGTATARNAILKFKGVPILYTPYISYPISDKRKSGLLLPALGRSDQRGVDVSLPYYWNIAPNYDATITPRYMSQRGAQLQTEFRYLTRSQSGQLRGEILPNDNASGETRSLVSMQHESQLGYGWRALVDATSVSDSSYFEDLYGSLSATSQTHLIRKIDFDLLQANWGAQLRLQNYQTLDDLIVDDDHPYTQAPKLSAWGQWANGPLGIEYGIGGEVTYFDRDTGLTGLRSRVRPELSWPIERRQFSIEPAVAVEHVRYNLDDIPVGMDDTPAATIPIYSIDMGTMLERTAGRTGRWLQTLEPRILFVHIPFSEQDDLPVFDTIEPDLNLVQLFRKNRFAGSDRIGDTRQLSMGITTRLIDSASGTQRLTGTIGQTLYFSDRNVTLPGEAASVNSSSDYLAELQVKLYDNWSIDLGYQWDSDQNVTQRAEARLQYRPGKSKVLNLSYRLRRNTLEEIDGSFLWPLSKTWNLVGRYQYSLLDEEPLERFAGLEYETCCWGARFVMRKYLANRTGETDTAIAFQLIFKGLANVGDSADRLLERGILGYERD